MTTDRAYRLRDRWFENLRRHKIHTPDGSDWAYSRAALLPLPNQGWKIHVPATPINALPLMSVCLDVAGTHGLGVKLPSSIDFLLKLNSGLGNNYSQIGKIFTIYVPHEKLLLQVCHELASRTKRYRCPTVPFDARFIGGKNVYVRYGLISGSDHLVAPDGQQHDDKREPGKAVPAWVDIPPELGAQFREADSTGAIDQKSAAALPADILVFSVLSQRGKGGVYLALDLSGELGKIRILKEGRRFGEMDPYGSDGLSLIWREVRVLRRLRSYTRSIPSVYRYFRVGANGYSLLEHFDGQNVGESIENSSLGGFEERYQLSRSIVETILVINQAGILWRDCKPTNIIWDGKTAQLIDFEGAGDINEHPRHMPWGTVEYMNPQWKSVPDKQDIYAAAITISQIFADSTSSAIPEIAECLIGKNWREKRSLSLLYAFLEGPSLDTAVELVMSYCSKN